MKMLLLEFQYSNDWIKLEIMGTIVMYLGDFCEVFLDTKIHLEI